ncbi:MAG: hypothetical protein ACYCR7_04795 [Thermoplasmataceae archaeon]
MANDVKRGKSVLKYAQIVEDYVEDEKKKTKIVKHIGRVHTEEDIDECRKLFALENLSFNSNGHQICIN